MVTLCTALSLLFATQTPDTLRYAILLSGNRAGSEVVVPGPNGSINVFQEWNDRGRGPKLETKVSTRGALIAGASISGHDYWKKPVNEQFTLSGDSARWSSEAERGGKRVTGPAFYVPFNGPISSLQWLLSAALTAPGGRLPLLPAGEARAEKLGERTVTANNRSARLTHYQLIGLDFVPTDLWIADDGSLFAFVGGTWFRVIREGWESLGDALMAAQDSARDRREERLARTLADKPAGAVALRNATLFDAPNARLVPGTTVIVQVGRITGVGPDADTRVPGGARIIDARGKTIVAIDPKYFRPSEVDTLLGDPTKAKQQLGWAPQVKFRELVAEMAREDLRAAERDALVSRHGYQAYGGRE